jgi:hypothetical protein
MDRSPRHRVCVPCRIGLAPEEPCDVDPAHQVAELSTPEGRELLVTATWGPPIVRHARVRASARRERAVLGVTFGGFAASAALITLGLPLVEVMGAIGAIGIFGLVGARVGRRREDQPYPPGGTDVVPGAPSGPRGAVSGLADMQSPASSSRCVAFRFELRDLLRGTERLLYRDAITCGFDVALDKGGLARIPAGRIHLLGQIKQVIDFDNRHIEAYLRDIDPDHDEDARFDPFRYSVICEQVLLPGQRVELASRFEPRVARTNREGGYREPAVSHLVPIGIPFVRAISDC